MTKSFYSILNVSPDADPAVIEAAYRALMKKYHPDVLAGQAESTQSHAAEINQAFRILRDPGRRAEYDFQQQARAEGLRPALAGADLHPMPFQPEVRRGRSKWVALCLVAALAGLLVYVWRNTSLGQPEYGSSWLSSLTARGAASLGREEIKASAPVSMRSIDRAVGEFHRLKNRSGLLGLSAFSQDCFAMRIRSGRSEDFDFCIAFDDAVLTYDAESAGNYALPRLPRFRSDEVNVRHQGAGRAIWDDDALIAARLAQIAALTRDRLARLPGDSEAPSPVVRPTAPASTASVGRQFAVTRGVRAERPPRRQAPPPPRREPRQTRQRVSDAEFMESQGYIY